MQEIILDCIADTVKIIPFLFLTYLLMEYIEHKTSDRTKTVIRRAGRMGPLFGGLLGAIPQCGFSAAAASFYSGGVITAGTLIAVFLSTSDEMLPIFLSQQVALPVILRVLLAKALLGILMGFLVDLVFRRFNARRIGENIHEICEHDHCQCEESIVKSALKHTLNITLFLLLVTFVLNLMIAAVGEENLAGLVLNRPVTGEILAGLIGLIPNCAASVIITTLYLEGVMSLGAMMSGLLVGAGVGLLVLFRTNPDGKENLQIAGLLYISGVLCGLLVEVVGLFIK